MEIEYRDIPGFPGYRVGNDGSVWSCRPQNGIGPLTTKWIRLKPKHTKKGHCLVSLHGHERQQYRYVHRLVLEAFIGPAPNGCVSCHFPDRNPDNNALANLRWDTQEANEADKIVHGTSNRGRKHTRAKA